MFLKKCQKKNCVRFMLFITHRHINKIVKFFQKIKFNYLYKNIHVGFDWKSAIEKICGYNLLLVSYIEVKGGG